MRNLLFSTLYGVWGGGGGDFYRKVSNFGKMFNFILFHLIFYVVYVITAP